MAALALVAHESLAHACDIDVPAPYVTSPVAGDEAPPGVVQVASRVREPASRQTVGCAFHGCADIGMITLTVTATDDRALPAALGYEVRVIGDAGPLLMQLDGKALAARDGAIKLPFKGTAAAHITFELRAVDPNGNVGPASKHVVKIPAAFPWWLAIGIGAPLLLVLVVIGIVRRRRR